MNKSITRKEITEQLGAAHLKFQFFRQNYFVFSGKDSLQNDVSMFVRRDVILYAAADSHLYVNDFADLGPNRVRFLVVSPDLHIIYQD